MLTSSCERISITNHRCCKRGGRGLLAESHDSYPPASEREAGWMTPRAGASRQTRYALRGSRPKREPRYFLLATQFSSASRTRKAVELAWTNYSRTNLSPLHKWNWIHSRAGRAQVITLRAQAQEYSPCAARVPPEYRAAAKRRNQTAARSHLRSHRNAACHKYSQTPRACSFARA